ncbi:hypothetical protein ORI20_03190 [Mycobacterium sp. CVI_P3]|uniref:Integral membrane protein n=1 Tax=Mycobacterium pinniadriaticum TaxID=2994102 RepID=A0ABT3S867_9MYCO|nr:hypothetical protein [Mycobacterium pinniadriaticum]MCX2929265.1 hypothetical protein [Mycobacterium pinniadriaticum]MCX2935690.1 hypothetical protein [Mycobacterium pinniadriaticum]
MSDQGKQYAAFIEAELKAEYDRRNGTNTRAAGALTGATGFVTLVLAVYAVLLHKDFTLSGAAKCWLISALMALLGAGILAVAAGLPWRYKATAPATLRYFLRESWEDSEVTARGRTAYCNMVVLHSLRLGNQIKTAFLIGAAVAQVVAIFSLALSVLALLGAETDAPAK